MQAKHFMQDKSGFVFWTANPECHKDCAPLTAKAGKDALREQAKRRLRDLLKPGDTVYTVLRHVSRSGMRRRIDLYAIQDSDIVYLSGYAAQAMDYGDVENGIKVDGCGMDMGFHLVHNLSYTLWPNGTDKPHGMRNGKPDSDGGYALKHRWI